MPHPDRIEGYAIVSEDGMIADAARIMPDSLIFEADKHFFERGLDAVDVVVHGRHSHEQQPHSASRLRLVVTHRVETVAPDSSNEKALFWNPAGASLEDALEALGKPGGSVGVVGGTDVFGLFLGRYDVFHLSRAPDAHIPGGRPVFPGVPALTPEEVLASYGMVPGECQVLDEDKRLTVVSWQAPWAGKPPSGG
jgi:dihydrofolate reductase